MNETLVARLLELADNDEAPWWWDVPERRGPGPILKEAAKRITELENRVVDLETMHQRYFK
jgi:hypothetical protein